MWQVPPPGWTTQPAANSPVWAHSHQQPAQPPYAGPSYYGPPPPTPYGNPQHVTQQYDTPCSSTQPDLQMRQRTVSTDVAYHPYKPPSASSKPICFVDTTQQAAAAATSGSIDPLQQCRPKRKRITPEQLVKLVAIFDTTDSPSYEIRETLSTECGMTNREVQVWFQNRRAKPYSPQAQGGYLAGPSAPRHGPHPPATVSPPLPQGLPSPYYGVVTPPLTVTTPSLASPSSASVSSYFSRNDAPYTPSTGTLSSPAATFFRLTLDSPRLPPLSPTFGSESSIVSSPKASLPEALITLAPIRTPQTWNRLALPSAKSSPLSRPMHRRSISDSAAHAAMLPPATKEIVKASALARPAAVRLPSLRGLLNDDAQAPFGTSSAPTSPVDSLNPLPSTSRVVDEPQSGDAATGDESTYSYPPSAAALAARLQRPSLISRYSSLDIHRAPSRDRRVASVASSNGDGSVRMSIDEDTPSDGGETARGDDLSRRTSVDTEAAGEARLGLGMLVAAASELRADDEKEARYLAASKQMR
ncbi:hypothetical protein Rhopal_004721-T1 [Rhodotorula paludigena]|uniref:Homeobox domain-containing protein n=1 Tax=Rhodotorula paludigena TaxID=86838 RepID=A0AAV5GND3_9BASI|nr:hypothetical protein Rhopal_004721-T1 [Rhodotorula paludigena]